jgi:aryl-alcohol dehydrogenase-like predicted oxidoreductase
MKPTYLENINEESYDFGHGSRLVYGCSGLGGVWGETNYEESVDCLLYAFENGIMSLDTSPSYNMSQTVVGKALAQWKGKRPFISTKVGRLRSTNAHDTVVDYSPARMTQSMFESLETLGIDHVDILFLHEPYLVPLEKFEEIIHTLKEFVTKGYTRMIGVGGNPTDAFRPYITKDNFQVVSGFLKLNACNLTGMNHDLPQCKENGVAYYAASALHFSLLGNRFDSFVESPPNDEWISNQDVKNAIKVNEIAKREGMKLSTLSQRFLFSTREANRVVMGARKMEQIKSTIEDWNLGVLPKSLFDEIVEAVY